MVIIEISVDQIIYMLDNPDKLTEDEKAWIDTFKKFMLEDFGGEDESQKNSA